MAMIAAVHDGTRSLEAGSMVTTSLMEHCSNLAPALLASAQGAVKRATTPAVWDLGLAKLMLLPAWVLFAVLGMAFAFVGRRRRRINVFAN